MGGLPGKRLVQLLLGHNQGVRQLATQLVDCRKVTKSGGHLGERNSLTTDVLNSVGRKAL